MFILQATIPHEGQELSFLINDSNLEAATGNLSFCIPVNARYSSSFQRNNRMTVPSTEITAIAGQEVVDAWTAASQNQRTIAEIGEDTFNAICQRFNASLIDSGNGQTASAPAQVSLRRGQSGTITSANGTVSEVSILADPDGQGFVQVTNYSLPGSPPMDVEISRFTWNVN